MSRDVLRQLGDPNVIAVACPLSGWPRNLLSPRNVPAGWLAVVQEPDGQRRRIVAGEAPRAASDHAVCLLLRDVPIRLSTRATGAVASDAHSISFACEFAFTWRNQLDDLAAARHAIPHDGVLTHAALESAIHAAGLEAALRHFVRSLTAAELVAGDHRPALLNAVRDHLRRFLFSVGLDLDAVTRADFSSPTLDRDTAARRQAQLRLEQLNAHARIDDAQRAAARRRLDDLAQLLARLRQAGGDGAAGWHTLLPSLNPAERGRLLENLWRLAPSRRKAHRIVLVSGVDLITLDPGRPERVLQRWSLPPDLGSLRSVTWLHDLGRLAVGAAIGVWLVDPADGAVAARLAVPAAGEPRTGFNAAASTSLGLAATHSELGCWRWTPGAAEPEPLLRPAGGVPRTIRAAFAAADGRLLFAADDRVCVCDPPATGPAPAPGDAAAGAPCSLRRLPTCGAPIHDVAVLDATIFVSTARGDVLRGGFDPDTTWEVLHRASGPVESIVPRRWDDLTELVVPSGRLGVLGVWGDEGVVSRLVESAVEIRRVAASDDLIVALTDMRDALLVLGEAAPGRTPIRVPLARTLARSIQDVCIVTA